jgi:hypothetical protein
LKVKGRHNKSKRVHSKVHDVRSGTFITQTQLSSKLKATVIVPYLSNPDFVGRSEILDELKHYFGLGQQQEGATPQARAALFGLGGIGYAKLNICREDSC